MASKKYRAHRKAAWNPATCPVDKEIEAYFPYDKDKEYYKKFEEIRFLIGQDERRTRDYIEISREQLRLMYQGQVNGLVAQRVDSALERAKKEASELYY